MHRHSLRLSYYCVRVSSTLLPDCCSLRCMPAEFVNSVRIYALVYALRVLFEYYVFGSTKEFRRLIRMA
jgi:hypothetical protein